MTAEQKPALARHGYCCCPECEPAGGPIPYKLSTPDDHYDTHREKRLVYASAFMVAFGLGTLLGLVLH